MGISETDYLQPISKEAVCFYFFNYFTIIFVTFYLYFEHFLSYIVFFNYNLIHSLFHLSIYISLLFLFLFHSPISLLLFSLSLSFFLFLFFLLSLSLSLSSFPQLHSLVMQPSNPFSLTEAEFDMLCAHAEAHSQDTIAAEYESAKVTSSSFYSTDKSARLVKQLHESGAPYLSIDGFVRAYEKHEAARVAHTVDAAMEEEMAESFALGHTNMHTRTLAPPPHNTHRLNDYARSAITIGRQRADIPLAFGSTGQLT